MQHVLDADLRRSERECLSRGRDDVELEAPGGDHRAVAPKFVFVLTHRCMHPPFHFELTRTTRLPSCASTSTPSRRSRGSRAPPSRTTISTLTAADGNEFAAFLATPDGPTATGIVILPDVRGLYHFYEELALRFAERGHAAIALDYFGRTAGAAKRDDEFEYMPHVEQTTDAGVQADARAAVDELRRARRDVDLLRRLLLRRPCVVGRRRVGPRPRRLDRLLRFADARARRRECRRSGPPRSSARSSRCRRATTRGSPPRTTPRSTQALASAGVEHEIVVYDGAPHSFFDRKQEDFAEASDDAWRRTLAFISQHS